MQPSSRWSWSFHATWVVHKLGTLSAGVHQVKTTLLRGNYRLSEKSWRCLQPHTGRTHAGACLAIPALLGCRDSPLQLSFEILCTGGHLQECQACTSRWDKVQWLTPWKKKTTQRWGGLVLLWVPSQPLEMDELSWHNLQLLETSYFLEPYAAPTRGLHSNST